MLTLLCCHVFSLINHISITNLLDIYKFAAQIKNLILWYYKQISNTLPQVISLNN